jgi:two-component system CheB/CheR fusion protein
MSNDSHPVATGRVAPSLQTTLEELLAINAEHQRKLVELSHVADDMQHLVGLLLDSTVEAIYGLDQDGKCSFCNQACADLLGFDDARELIGRDMHRLVHRHRADDPTHCVDECALGATLRHGISVHHDDEPFTRADGSLLSVEYRSHPLRRDGELVGAVVTFLDITQRKRAEEELRIATRRREQFLAMLSHELRNPLAALLNATTVLELPALGGDAADPADHGTRARGVVERQTRHMARLLDDLLDVSRITSGKLRLRERPCDLHDAIQGGIEAIAPMLAEHRIELCRELPPEPLPMRGDPARLQQVVTNLLSNAVRHSEPGGRIELAVQREGDHVRISLRDHGTGIDAELLPQIFDLFVQSEQELARSRGGLGVGLTLVRWIVELHGGTVGAHSDGIGRGSEFVVRLPLCPAAHESLEDPGTAIALPCRIVLVEDQPDAREMMRLLLITRGHDVVEAADGVSGIDAIERVRPHAALVDIGLPTMSGYDVARRIRRNRALDSVILVAVTGYGAHADIEAARDAGFDEHLTKPADTGRLESILARCGPLRAGERPTGEREPGEGLEGASVPG